VNNLAAVGIELFIVSIVYVAVSVFLQRKLSDMKKVYAIQEETKQKSKELSDLAKANAGKEEIAKKQQELMALMQQSMRAQIKPMLIILPLFFIVYYLLLPYAFASSHFVFQFAGMKLGYRLFFIFIAFIVGLISSIFFMIHDRIKIKKEEHDVADVQQVQ